jgi:WD40 repeat protein/tetratricopeptide (TPR) repeat protein
MNTSSSSSSDRNPVEELAAEFLDRKRRGERPTLEDYCRRHPELADDIRELFPVLLRVEDLGGDGSGAATGGPPPCTGPRLARLGDYRILREVGRGGMAIVYEAEQESLGRRVALKVLPDSALSDARQVLRFQREAKAAARLHHTNIVPVFGVGRDDGHHYYVMQFIPGMGLDAVLEELKRLRRGGSGTGQLPSRTASRGPVSAADVAEAIVTGRFALADPGHAAGEDGVADTPTAAATVPLGDPQPAPAEPPLPSLSLPGASADSLARPDPDRAFFRSVARIGFQVAEALEYANRQGILHRDVKPSNLLLDPKGNVWVADFGLAKAADTEDLTHSGDIVGTVRYMAPERFQGKCEPRSDVYALGLTLYELLALRPAFAAADRQALIQRVMTEEPARLRTVVPHLPRDLETIVEKAITREPAGRYASAAAMAEDLRAFLEGRPIRARRAGAAERLAKWARRRPAIAALASALLVAMVGLLGLGVWSYARINRALAESQKALEAETKALGAERKALEAAVEGEYKALLNETIGKIEAKPENWQEDSLKNLKRLAGFETPARDPVRLRSLAVTVLMDFGVKEVRRLRGHSGRVWSIDFSPDGRTMATLDHGGRVRLWEFPSGRLLRSIHDPSAQKLPPFHSQSPRPIVQFDPLGRYLAYTTWSHSVEFLPLDGHKAPAVKPKSGVPPRALSFDRAGKVLVVGWADGRIDLLDAATGATKSSRRTTAKLGGIDRRVALDRGPGDFHFVPCGPISPEGHGLAEWSPTSAGVSLRIVGLAEHETSILVNTNANLLASTANLLAPTCFRPDGAVLATGGEEQVALCDVRTGKEIAVLHHPDGYQESPTDVAFSPRGDLLAEVGYRGTLRLWDPDSEKSLLRLRTGLGELHSLAWSPDGLHLAIGGTEAVILYQLTGRGARHFVAQESRTYPTALAPHPHQALVASGNDQGEIELLDARSGRVVKRWVAYPSSTERIGVWPVAFDPSGSLIAAGPDAHGFITIWEERTGQLRCRLTGYQGRVMSLDWDPAGRRIASGTDRGEVLIYDVATGTAVRAWQRGSYIPGPIVAFLEGGGALVVGQANGLIEVLDVATGQPRQRAIVEFGVYQMTISPDRRRLVASHGDGRFTAFSLPELTRIYASEQIHDHPPGFLAFSADGRWLVTGAYGNAAVLWATDSWQPVLSLKETMSSFNGWINPIAFLADRSSLVVGHRAQGVDGWAIWDLSQIWTKLDELGLGWEASEAGRTRLSGPVARTAAVTQRTMLPAFPLKLCMDFLRWCLELEPNQAQACTDLAWHLATNPDAAPRDPREALRWAQNAVRLAPDSPLCWNTLGAVHYRLGQYQEAIAALQKSIGLNADVPTAHDALFLSMSHQRLGQPDQARAWYDRALQARQELGSIDPRCIEEQDRIQAEAETLLMPAVQP